MHTVPSPMTVADYCAAMARSELKVNRDYQRSNKVWPPAARSSLIETLILGFPTPKVFLFQRTDLISKKTIKEIVDGQQRSGAIFDFYNGKLKIQRSAKNPRLAGKGYDELETEDKEAFLSYQISVDLFVGAQESDIREAFRRLNSYTVPLNPEELRHANWQGEFKQFINDQVRKFEEYFLQMGVFGPRQMIRMADAKLLTEICRALLFGIETTNSRKLDAVYKQWDDDFPMSSDVESALEKSVLFVWGLSELRGGPLMKPHIFYSLIVALALSYGHFPALSKFPAVDMSSVDESATLANLIEMANSLQEDSSSSSRFGGFIKASSEKTNVQSQREERVAWFLRALGSDRV